MTTPPGEIPDRVPVGLHNLPVASRMVGIHLSISGKTTVLRMIDPADVPHRGIPDLVVEKSGEALEIMAPGGRFILGPGCALVPETPEDNVMVLIESAAKYGRYRSDGTLARDA